MHDKAHCWRGRSLGLSPDPCGLWVSGLCRDQAVGQSASSEDAAASDEEQGPQGAFVIRSLSADGRNLAPAAGRPQLFA